MALRRWLLSRGQDGRFACDGEMGDGVLSFVWVCGRLVTPEGQGLVAKMSMCFSLSAHFREKAAPPQGTCSVLFS